MAAKLAFSSYISTEVHFLPNLSPLSPLTHTLASAKKRVHSFKIHAIGGGDGELKPKGKKKFITREEEPEQLSVVLFESCLIFLDNVKTCVSICLVYISFFINGGDAKCRYWQTAGEREGENPMKTPLPYIIIFGMSTPFVILAIAFANGWIKVPVR